MKNWYTYSVFRMIAWMTSLMYSKFEMTVSESTSVISSSFKWLIKFFNLKKEIYNQNIIFNSNKGLVFYNSSKYVSIKLVIILTYSIWYILYFKLVSCSKLLSMKVKKWLLERHLIQGFWKLLNASSRKNCKCLQKFWSWKQIQLHWFIFQLR